MEYKVVIKPNNKLFSLNLKELFSYKDLIKLFVKKDFISKYKQTLLGPLWAIIQPLFTTVVFTIVFGKIANLTIADIPGDFIIPSFLFYMAGSICWNYFSSTLSAVSSTFISNRRLMSKVYFHRLVMPISTTISRLISFFIQFVLLIIIWLFYLIKGGTSIKISFMLLLIPLIIVQMMLLAMGFGIVVSSLTTKYRDLQHTVSFVLQLWHYLSPIAYGLALVPEKYLAIYLLNPVTPIITSFRYALFGFGYFNITSYLISWLITIVVLVIGLLLFSKIERTFVDTI